MNTENTQRSNSEILKMVSDLRKATGFGIQDCKNALVEHNFDANSAAQALRAKYASKYKMDSDSVDLELQEFVSSVLFDKDENELRYLAAKTKSDVVTRSEKTRDLFKSMFNYLEKDIYEDSKTFDLISNNDVFKNELDDFLSYFREPFKVEKLNVKKLTHGEVMSCYSHNVYHKNEEIGKSHIVAKSSAPIVLKYDGELSADDVKKIERLAYVISMTIVGLSCENTKVFYKNELDSKLIEDFRQSKIEEAKASGKPEKAIEKIVEGQLQKFYQENLISELKLVTIKEMDWLKFDDKGEISIDEAIKQTEKFLNCKLSVSFYRILTSN